MYFYFRNEKSFVRRSKMSSQIPEEEVIECYDSKNEPIFTVEISDRYLTEEPLTNGEALRQRLSSGTQR